MKSKGHIYMANLIIEELKTKGSFIIDNNGKMEKYDVPGMVRDAILKYPTYFRGGAVGPDFFPDMIVGQMIIHPTDSGKWLELMYNELCTMAPDYEETKQAMAFYLGFMVHYAGDMFTHGYVNKYSGGWFPEIKGILTKFKQKKNDEALKDMFIIVRHFVLESYMDKVIFDNLRAINKRAWVELESTIEIPVEYLRSCFATVDALGKASTITGDNPNHFELSDLNFLKAYVNYSEDYRKKSLDNYYKSKENIDLLDLEEFASTTQKVDDDIARMDRLIFEWFKLWESTTNKSITLGSKVALDEIKPELFEFILDYCTQNTSILDIVKFIKVVKDFCDTFGIRLPILDIFFYILEKIIKDELKEMAFPFVKLALSTILEKEKIDSLKDYDDAIDIAKKEFLSPAHLISNPILFQDFTFDLSNKLEEEWGNLGRTTDGNTITFLPFYQGFVMSKLCLMGAENVNGIFEKYGSNERFKQTMFSPSIQKLRVIVKTAKESPNNSRDVYLVIARKNNKEIVMPLANARKNFRANRLDIFSLNLPCSIALNEIASFKIKHLSKDKWIYSHLTIVDERTEVILARSNKTILSANTILQMLLFDNVSDLYTNSNVINSISKLKVTIKTSGDTYSGTDNDVKLSVVFTNNTSKEFLLDKSNYNDFEAGDLDTYELTLDKPVYLEEIKYFSICKSGDDDWKLKYIQIFDAETHICICNETIDKVITSSTNVFLSLSDEGQLEKLTELEENAVIEKILVKIKTKDVFLAGTDNKVILKVNYYDKGQPDDFEIILDKNWTNNFERNDLDTFICKLEKPIKKSNLASFDLYTPDSDHWYVEYFSVYDNNTLYHFGTVEGKWMKTENDILRITIKHR